MKEYMFKEMRKIIVPIHFKLIYFIFKVPHNIEIECVICALHPKQK